MASSAPTFPSTKDTINYARLCRLLVDVGTRVLKETFDNIYPPRILHLELGKPTVLNLLQSLQKKKILNLVQWNHLYPSTSSQVSSKNFDITLLVLLLRNICGLTPPASGWDTLPSLSDISVQADIARVKYYRNTVYGHAAQASVDDVTFNYYWKEIRSSLVRLGGPTYEEAIDKLRTDPLDPETEEHYRKLLREGKTDEDNLAKKIDELSASIERRFAPTTGKSRVLIHYEIWEITCKWQNHSFVSNKLRLPSTILIVTNNKNVLYKTVRLSSFQKPQFSIRSNLLQFLRASFCICCVINIF